MKTLTEIYEILDLENNIKKTFTTFEHKILTYGELNQRVIKISALFASKKVFDRSRIIICSDDDEVVITFTIAALFNGLTSIVLSPDTKTIRANSLIALAHPDFLVIDAELANQWGLSNAPNLFPIRQSLNNSSSSNNLLSKFVRGRQSISWLDDLSNSGRQEPSLKGSGDRLAFINFTSGSTGQPKGVKISYKNLFVHLETFGGKFEYSSHSRILNNLPLSHADGLIQGPILTLYFGSQLYRSSSMEIQQLESYLNTIYRERITHVITVPTIWSLIDRLTTYPDYFDSEDFKYPISVAGMLNLDLWARLEARFNIKLSNIYGLTETVLGGIFCGPDTDSYCRGSIGKPLDMDVEIVDSAGNRVKNGEVGELWLRGDNVFMGYFEEEQATAEVFRDRWFCTGDLARQDRDGYIYICGRKKETIISGGFNIQPNEVNEVLLKYNGVTEAATIGVVDRDWGEIVVSAVVCSPDLSLSEVDLIAHCRDLLEQHKVPKQIVFLDSLPKGGAGKVKIPQLKQILQAQDEMSGNGKLTIESFFKLVSDVFRLDGRIVSLNDRSGQLPGWDSLGHLNLILSVEKATGIRFSPHEIMNINSLNDLWDKIVQFHR